MEKTIRLAYPPSGPGLQCRSNTDSNKHCVILKQCFGDRTREQHCSGSCASQPKAPALQPPLHLSSSTVLRSFSFPCGADPAAFRHEQAARWPAPMLAPSTTVQCRALGGTPLSAPISEKSSQEAAETLLFRLPIKLLGLKTPA